jgi:hypothetical protein
VTAARAAAVHAGGLTLGQRADLGGLLISRAGIGPEAALAIVSPRVAPAPKQPAARSPPDRSRPPPEPAYGDEHNH